MSHRNVSLVVLLCAASSPALAEPPAWGRLGARRLVARGGHVAPRFSPDGSELLVTGPRFAGLAILPVDRRGTALVLADDEGAGVDGRFLPDGRVAFRALRAGERRALVADRTGAVRSAARAEVAATVAIAVGDRIYVRSGPWLENVGTGDRFFGPVVSPDGARVAFVGLATGIWVYELADRSLTHVGQGTAPAWSPSGLRLVFERTEDDGHEIVASDLWLWERHRGPQRLTFTDDILERRPALAPDGASLAYDDDEGAIWIAPLEVQP